MGNITRRAISGIAILTFVLSTLGLTGVAASAAVTPGQQTTASALLDGLPVATPSTATYSRTYFNLWIDADGNGCDTRQEVLIAESQIPVTYSTGCTITSGQWYSWYDGATWTNPSDVDIDHFVPLEEAWKSGASTWTAAQREAYANDLAFAPGLEAVTDNVNQSKGSSDPAGWLPPLQSAQCQYAVNWVEVKYRWNLSIDTTEKSALTNLLSGSCGSAPITAPALGGTPAQQSTWPLYKIVYDSTIYELVTNGDGTQTAVPLTFAKWRDVYAFQNPAPASTDFVKYPWSATIYAVTFWPGGEGSWQWTRLSYQQWQTAHFPGARNAGWIKGSYFYKWGTSGEILVVGEDGSHHKLTGPEWAASGYRPYVDRSNEGFMKLSWANDIARMNNISAGQGYALSYPEWSNEAFPTPQTVQRIPGDQFYQNYGNSTIWYAGPTMNRPVSYNEWAAAGYPTPAVHNAPAPGPTPPPTQNGVTPGAYCSTAGAMGYSDLGVLYTCKTSATDSRLRWRQ